jgi:DNA-binding PadR family transcriptional regulator
MGAKQGRNRSMSLPHALLTALLEHPCSGSELAGRFDRSIGYFWPATHQQIYRELGRLEQAGWVESLPPTGRGGKRVYEVLPAGRAELARWTGESQQPKPLRDELMVRLRAEAAIGPTPALLREIERQRQLHAQKLELYRQIEARDFPGEDASRVAELQHLVLTAGVMLESFWVEFCDKAIHALSPRAEAAAKSKAAARKKTARD